MQNLKLYVYITMCKHGGQSFVQKQTFAVDVRFRHFDDPLVAVYVHICKMHVGVQNLQNCIICNCEFEYLSKFRVIRPNLKKITC